MYTYTCVYMYIFINIYIYIYIYILSPPAEPKGIATIVSRSTVPAGS